MQQSQLNIKKQKTKFLRISCPRCYTNQTIFGKSSLIIKCDKCNKRLIDITGGKARIRAQVKEIWNT